MSELNNDVQNEAQGLNSRKNSTLIVAGVGIVLLIIVLFQWFVADDDYLIAEQQWREQRDLSFKKDMDSPIPDSLKDQFEHLNWFPVSREYRVTAKFEKNPVYETIEMPRSKSTPEQYIVAGWLHFKVKGQALKLRAYQPNPKDSKVIFVPFRDLTSAKTTYGGGRYIDTRIVEDKVTLDFNRAYNPYCVYNYDFACPIPPEENRLNVEILAGEKDFSFDQATSAH